MTHAILPWPPKELSPNARVHWAKKAKAAKKYHNECVWLMFPERKQWRGKKNFSVSFCPPDNRRRDIDNMLSSCKALVDAVSTITFVDDSEFQFTISKAPPVKGGAVRVEAI